MAGAVVGSASALVSVAAGLGLTRRRRGHAVESRWRAALSPLALTAAAIVCACASASAALVMRSAGPVDTWAADRAFATLDARVTGSPRRVSSRWTGPQRWMVTVETSSTTARGSTWHGTATLTVLGPQEWSSVVTGSSIRTRGRLTANPAGQWPVATLATSHEPTVIAPPASVWRAAEGVRSGLREAVARGSPDAAGLLPALVVGDTTAVPPDLESAMRGAGLTHLTAVSGANLAIVLGAVLALAMCLRVPRPLRLTLAVATVVAFVVVARPQPSVLRAAAMGSVVLLGLWSGRGTRGLHALTAAALGLLIWDPWLSRSYGFALSVLATGALLTLAPLLVDRMPGWLPRVARLALAVPVAAQAVTTPVVLLLQPGVSLVGIPANVLAAPAAALATVSGAAAAALAPLVPAGAALVAQPGLLAASVISGVARTAAAVPASRLPWPQGRAGSWAAALVVGAGVAALLVLARRPAAPPGRTWWTARTGPTGRTRWTVQPGRGRRRWAVAAGLVAVIATGVGWAAAPRLPTLWPGAWPPAGWFVVQCDVGQGSATVVRTGPGSAVLVDAGPEPDLVDRCLRRLAVQRLDLVVLTHHHADHVLGLPGALGGRTTREALVNPLAEPADTAQQVVQWLRAAGVSPTLGQAGVSGVAGSSGGGVRWRALSPRSPVPGAGSGRGGDVGDDDDEGSAINDASTAVLLQVGERTVVVLGDLEHEGQSALLRAWPADVAAVDVVTVAHHGSSRQVPALYRRLRAAVALVGVGENDYGHPAATTTSMVASTGASLARTDEAGDIAVLARSDGSMALAFRRATALGSLSDPRSGQDGVVGAFWQAEPHAPSPPLPRRRRATALARHQSRPRARGPRRGARGARRRR
jgi:competence protein ComEC